MLENTICTATVILMKMSQLYFLLEIKLKTTSNIFRRSIASIAIFAITSKNQMYIRLNSELNYYLLICFCSRVAVVNRWIYVVHSYKSSCQCNFGKVSR